MKSLKFYFLFLLGGILFTGYNAEAQTWQKKEPKLKTDWTDKVDPGRVLPEYPRPQMVRDNWVNLNGIWDFAKKDTPNIGNYNDFTCFDQKILVPYPIESALSGIMDDDYTNMNKLYAYKRTFNVPASYGDKRILLHFGAVDWRSVVFINGQKAGAHEGGYLGGGREYLGDEEWSKQNFYRETENIVKSLINYPSIVMWVPYNEGWGQYTGQSPYRPDHSKEIYAEHTRNGVEVIRRTDPTRLINQSSGWGNFEMGDIIDVHSYTQVGLWPNPFDHRANMCGETGGFGLKIHGNIWPKVGTPYGELETTAQLADELEAFNERAYGLTFRGLSGIVYTQITDLEEEINGLYTYDRKVSKLDLAQKACFKAGVEKLLTQTCYSKAITPTAMQSGTMWKYTSIDPGPGWNTSEFNDSKWHEDAAGFGAGDPPGTNIRTIWNTSDIWLRQNLVVPALTGQNLKDLKLLIYYDEDYSVYINGVLAASGSGWTSTYTPVDINDETKAAIRFNQENLIAVTCHNTEGGQYMDVALSLVIKDIPINEDIEFAEAAKEYKEISDRAGLEAIKNNLSGSYILTKDIDLSGTDFIPIGSETSPFTGYFSGGKHTIKNLKITNNADNQGLFGYTKGAQIEDLILGSPQVNGNEHVGSLAGKAVNTTIQRVQVNRPVVSAQEVAGGIVGTLGDMDKGISGVSWMLDCYVVDGTISASASRAGGLIGQAYDISLQRSYFTGTVSALDGAAGGILGEIGNFRVQFKGVASLASTVAGRTAGEFAASTATENVVLVEREKIYTRNDMDIVGSSEGLRAVDFEVKELNVFKTQALYESMGWDFNSVWTMSAQGYPVFR